MAVEVKSPSDRMNKITRRISQFLKWGVALVWLLDPEDRPLAIHRPDKLPEVLEENEELVGDGILPDFAVAWRISSTCPETRMAQRRRPHRRDLSRE